MKEKLQSKVSARSQQSKLALHHVLVIQPARDNPPDDVSMVTAMRRSHWMRGPNILSNGWLSSTELFQYKALKLVFVSDHQLYFNLRWLKIHLQLSHLCFIFCYAFVECWINFKCTQSWSSRKNICFQNCFTFVWSLSDLIFSLWSSHLTPLSGLFCPVGNAAVTYMH